MSRRTAVLSSSLQPAGTGGGSSHEARCDKNAVSITNDRVRIAQTFLNGATTTASRED